MQTLKFQLSVGASRQLVIELPPGSEGAVVDVTVVLHPPHTPSPSADSDEARQARLDALFDHLVETGPHTPKAELDRRIQEERDAWGD